MIDKGDQVAAQEQYHDKVGRDQEKLQVQYWDWRSATVVRSDGKMRN